MSNVKLKTYILGTAVKITTHLSEAEPDTATITIFNPSDAKMVTAAAMTKDADNVYSYVYQSSSSDNDGEYTLQVTVVQGSYTSVSEEKFIMVSQTGV